MSKHNNRRDLQRLEQQQALKHANRPDHVVRQSWQEVNSLYQTLAEAIVNAGIKANEAIRIINSQGYDLNRELIVTTNGLNRDLKSFSDDMVAVRERHANRVGTITSEADLLQSYDAFESYKSIFDRFNAVIPPAMLTITEYLMEATQKTAEQSAQQVPVTTETQH